MHVDSPFLLDYYATIRPAVTHFCGHQCRCNHACVCSVRDTVADRQLDKLVDKKQTAIGFSKTDPRESRFKEKGRA